jgi:cytochrome c-type biogenesis protein CcmF
VLNAVLGQVGVWLALAAALAGVVVLGVSLVRAGRGRPDDPRLDGRLFAPLLLGGAVLATAAMEHALITHDFTLVYVADNNARATPLVYSITGLWSALAGSILLWGLVLAAITVVLVWRYRRRSADPVVRWATLVMYAVAAFFFGLMAGPANPFLTVPGRTPLRGAGPNALLQDNPLVAVHPPFLYLGLVGFTVPFAFAVGMLATGRVGDRWLVETRRWTLFSWTCLSFGILLGAWWSYEVLGWGGFWGWDPVENAALMPWLCGTAYLHSVLVQERRGLLRVWNLSLSIATFALTILATFLTRSGVVESVHAFSESTLGPVLIGFFILVSVVGFGLLAWRGDRLRSPGGIDAPLGREGAFLVNNLLFVGFAFVVLLGTLFPILYQAVRDQAVTVGAPYFNTIAVPVGLALLLLMAVAPALSWRKVDGDVLWRRLRIPAWTGVLTVVACVAAGVRGLEPLVGFGLGAFAAASAARSLVLSVRASRRHGAGVWRGLVGRTNGGMVVHLGVVVLAVGLVAATSFRHTTELALHRGRPVTFDGHTFAFEGLRVTHTTQRTATEARIRVDGGGPFAPAVSRYDGPASEAVGTPAIDSGLFGDVYMTLSAIGGTGASTGAQGLTHLAAGSVGVTVVVEPLIAWMWAGGIVVALGGLLALVPGGRRRPTDPVSAPAPGVSAASSASVAPDGTAAAGAPGDRGGDGAGGGGDQGGAAQPVTVGGDAR